jgi:hypothetical protein
MAPGIVGGGVQGHGLVVRNTFLDIDDRSVSPQEPRRPRAVSDLTDAKLPLKVQLHGGESGMYQISRHRLSSTFNDTVSAAPGPAGLAPVTEDLVEAVGGDTPKGPGPPASSATTTGASVPASSAPEAAAAAGLFPCFGGVPPYPMAYGMPWWYGGGTGVGMPVPMHPAVGSGYPLGWLRWNIADQRKRWLWQWLRQRQFAASDATAVRREPFSSDEGSTVSAPVVPAHPW